MGPPKDVLLNLSFTCVTSVSISTSDTEISQPLSVLPHLGAWEKARFFQNDGLTECKITRFMLLPLTLLKMR